ncbi:O-antigen ligase family protein [uncultured Rikenella sp.]|uniref:O-antigen ligase family protein n=1 Tax=uncultured Rikenella sp. TaxID=368003 RepID=UPI00261AA87E|nr:O-antigen ligase family protein [uncultured Rikenella sp.]
MKKELFITIGEYFVALAAGTVFYIIPVTSSTLHNGLTTAKYFTLLPLLVIFAAAVTLHMAGRLRNRTASYRLTATDAVAGLGLAYYLLNTALWGTADPMRLIFAAGMGMWYAGLRILFTSERIFRVLLLILLLAAGYEAALGILQSCGERVSNHALYAATGTFYNPGPYGGFLAVFLPVALYGMLRRLSAEHPLYRWVAGSVFFLSLVILPITMSRTAWAAALAGCGAVIVVRYFSTLRLFASCHRKLYLGMAVGAGVMLIAGATATWHMKRDSAEGRLLIWKNSTRMIGEQPVLGCGFGRFAGAYGEEQAAYFAAAPRAEREVLVAGTPDDAFNEYLHITTEGGLVGGLLFVLAAGFCLYGLWRRRASTGGLFFGAVSLLVFAFASYPFSLAEFLLAGVFLLAAAAPAARGIRVNRYVAFLFWAVVMLPLTFVLWRHEKPREKAYREWHTDHMMYGMKLYEQVARSAKEQYPLLKAEPAFLYEYGHSLHFTGDYAGSNAILTEGAALSADPMFRNVMGNNYKALGDPSRAESCYLRAYYMVPNRIYPLYLLAKLYRETGQTDKLEPMCRRVLDFQEKVTSPATMEIKREVATWHSENQ